MKGGMKIPVFILILVIGLVLFSAVYFLARSEMEVGFVEKVTDGDTLELNTSEKVRLIGINSPERGEPLYRESRERMENLVLGKKVYMQKDEEERDRYGRLLRYVYIGDEMVNLIMLEEGLATVYILEPNDAYEKIFRNAEESAMNSRLGIWSRASEHRCARCLSVEINWNAEGDDCKNANDEWVKLQNRCSFGCDLTGWSVKDSGTTKYTFHVFTLGPGSSVTLHSGSGRDSAAKLYWDKKGSCPAIWNNDGDTLYLRDAEGRLVLKEIYEGFS
ncbi:MAG: thermonuclease family protein [archaeon]|nr:MAG: thermonuclease family protein [archaeon]